VSATWRALPASQAIEATSEVTALPAVTLVLDGQALIAAFEPDRQEHDRRSTLGVGSVTSRPTLHGLWLLPAGIAVPTEALPAVKQRRLREAHPFAVEIGSFFERRYAPPGVVRAVAFTGREPQHLLDQAIRFTPIVERLVVISPGHSMRSDDWRLAEEFGVGIVEIGENGARVLVGQQEATLGVPAVFRWWIAELAYESWLQQSAQPVS
jgi:hypothetical protein